jgi:hypothetical protein
MERLRVTRCPGVCAALLPCLHVQRTKSSTTSTLASKFKNSLTVLMEVRP